MITREQAINADTFHVFNARKGKCDTWRRNGQTQTWVTRPNEFRIPVKFGMYSFDQLTHSNNDGVFVALECPYCNKGVTA